MWYKRSKYPRNRIRPRKNQLEQRLYVRSLRSIPKPIKKPRPQKNLYRSRRKQPGKQDHHKKERLQIYKQGKENKIRFKKEIVTVDTYELQIE